MAKASVLLVEDSVSDQVMVERALEDSRICCNLTIANNGVEALEMLTHQSDEKTLPNLVLMDINMPAMDGKQTLKAIRQSPNLRHIPVIMLTTSDAERDVLESYQLGVNAYLTKPILAHDFINKIREIESFWFELVVLPSS
ncbi:response regulator [Glaciecola sp. 1036]|uniref:response regulator n=1 Tax=Alteromonadaceae TaxID=72275 RepID=UPI003D07D10E